MLSNPVLKSVSFSVLTLLLVTVLHEWLGTPSEWKFWITLLVGIIVYAVIVWLQGQKSSVLSFSKK